MLTIVVGLAFLVLTPADLSDVGRWTATVYVAGVIGWAGVGTSTPGRHLMRT